MPPRLPLTDPAFVQNPYPLLEELREQTPVFFDASLGKTVFLRYDDIAAVLRDKRFGRTLTHLYSRDELGWPPPDPAQANFDAFNGNHMLDSEGEKHTRLRSLVGKAFSPRRVEQLQPRIEAILHERLQALGPTFDLVSDYAEPLPVTVIAELLGVPPHRRAMLRPWSAAIVKLYEPHFTRTQQAEAERAVLDFSALIRALAAQRRAAPADDLITALVQVEDGGEVLSESELTDTCILLLNAGHEASVNGLSAAVLALLRQPAHWEALVQAAGAEDSLATFRAAVEELLRYDTPLPMFERYVLEDLEWQGPDGKRWPLRTGDKVALLYASGNRDPRRFDAPDELNLRREPNPHLTFGLGRHYCLGAPLARLELSLSLRALVRHAPQLRLSRPDAAPEYAGGFVIRGLQRLDVRV
ncbi:cytochrome P450 [Deinococcus irradiatisoli]|uniref:Cytochrome P450 n=1 Tax=Deinococcus irradiatisoli TaxID=2202254 RepID=A0A2Z3JNU1_9DEIO|nr:cytochrome P450 [Deinococcus irradiatisoli]AWN23208.1 cytochrome P450 [Deinococcus irradiatisoli]